MYASPKIGQQTSRRGKISKGIHVGNNHKARKRALSEKDAKPNF